MSKRRADIGQTVNEIVAEQIVAFLNGSNFTGTIVSIPTAAACGFR